MGSEHEIIPDQGSKNESIIKYLQEQLDLAERNLKVMIMQDCMNDLLAQHWGARVMFAGVKNYIPDMGQSLREHPRYDEFKDLSIEDFLRVWPGIVRMKPWDLKEAVKGMNIEVDKARNVLKEKADDTGK